VITGGTSGIGFALRHWSVGPHRSAGPARLFDFALTGSRIEEDTTVKDWPCAQSSDTKCGRGNVSFVAVLACLRGVSTALGDCMINLLIDDGVGHRCRETHAAAQPIGLNELAHRAATEMQ
jgi:hypothetical protein